MTLKKRNSFAKFGAFRCKTQNKTIDHRWWIKEQKLLKHVTFSTGASAEVSFTTGAKLDELRDYVTDLALLTNTVIYLIISMMTAQIFYCVM